MGFKESENAYLGAAGRKSAHRDEISSSDHGAEGWGLLGDVLAGYEYSDAHRSARRQTPEYRLIEEVLLDAIELAMQFKAAPAKPGKRFRDQYEAWEWLFEDEQVSRLFSAETICGLLGIDLGRLRATLEAGKVGKLRGRRTGAVACRAMKIEAPRHKRAA